MNSNEPADAHATQIPRCHEAAHGPGTYRELARDLAQGEQGLAAAEDGFVLASERRAAPQGRRHTVGVRLHRGPPE